MGQVVNALPGRTTPGKSPGKDFIGRGVIREARLDGRGKVTHTGLPSP